MRWPAKLGGVSFVAMACACGQSASNGLPSSSAMDASSLPETAPPSDGATADAGGGASSEAGSSTRPLDGGSPSADAIALPGDSAVTGIADSSLTGPTDSAATGPMDSSSTGPSDGSSTPDHRDASDAGAPSDSAVPPSDAATEVDSIAPSDSGPLPPPVSDTTSTLGISAPGAGYVVEGNIAYGSSPMQRLDVMYPVSAGPKGTTTLPGVIMFHGGGWTDDRPQALKASMSSFFSRFLAHGFLVCNVEYRLADGTANSATAPAADEDALLAAKWFWNYMDYYHVDRTKYVVTGASAGGQLALMVGMATPAAQLGPTSPADYQIAAVVNGYGPSDVTDLLAKNISWAVQWLPATTPNRAAVAIQSVP